MIVAQRSKRSPVDIIAFMVLHRESLEYVKKYIHCAIVALIRLTSAVHPVPDDVYFQFAPVDPDTALFFAVSCKADVVLSSISG